MKKKTATHNDKKEWFSFLKNLKNVPDKEDKLTSENQEQNKIIKLDLHGFSLDEANISVKKFVTNSFENGYKKLLIVTGKGLRSKIEQNPYLSQQMNVLKHSIPEFIKKDSDLFSMIKKIQKAEQKDGGEGAFYVFLKKKL